MMDFVFERRLLQGERLLWSGRPRQGVYFQAIDMILVPFGLVFGGSAGFMATMAFREGVWYFSLFCVPFVLVGLFLAVGRFFVDAYLRQSTAYAVTTMRVLFHRGPPFGTFSVLDMAHLPEVELTTQLDGRGTITFGTLQQIRVQGETRTVGNQRRFEGIADAQAVFDTIQRVLHPA